MIVAGEASGDLHGARLVTSMRTRMPDLQFCGIGGPELEKYGVELLYDASKIAVVGFFEVATHLNHILKAQKTLRNRLSETRPKLLILIDFPDFNLLLARKARKLGIPVFYYISPQVWAWRSGRVKTIEKLVDAIGVILPFEEQFYRERGVAATYVGHPLLDSVRADHDRETFCRNNGLDAANTLIGILPGSRIREVAALFPVFLEAALQYQQKSAVQPTFLVPCAPTIDAQTLYENGLSDYADRIDARIIEDDRYSMMASCAAVIAASGTVTLELLLLNTPAVVAYKLAPLTYRLGKLLVKIDYFSLVNLIASEPVVTELLQHDASVDNIAGELDRLVHDQTRRKRIFAGYESVRKILGKRGASDKAAALAMRIMEGNP